jgi:hypothetical protein
MYLSFILSFYQPKHLFRNIFKGANMAKSNPMSKSSAARIQGAAAKANGGGAPKGHFAGRAQVAAEKNSSKEGK